MIRFLYPELFLLAIPLWFAYSRWGRARGVTGAIRLAILLALLTALAGPRADLAGAGLDVLVVADRSRSLPSDADGRMRELIRNLQAQRGEGDRVAVVTFGAKAAPEMPLSQLALLGEYQHEVLPDGSDLNEALHTALNLVDAHRPARIVVFSDGEANGASPTSAARRARDMRVPVDFREFPRIKSGDVAVESLLLPDTVAPGAPFQFTVWIHSGRETSGRVSVFRDGEPIAEDVSSRRFSIGMNRLLFRDLLVAGGLHNYEVRLDVVNDPVYENNRGAGVVRVEAGPKLLVVNTDGEDDNFIRALRAGRVPVDVQASKTAAMSPENLDQYRAVVLENVPAAALGRLKLERLVQYVEDLGGGLLMTGGESSFGVGGYFKGPLDDVLPVSMELRDEHRKTRMALAIALDRSGSMAAPVRGNRVKMDLANLGAAEAIRMLSTGDSVAVIAVDSAPHVIQPLVPVDRADAIAAKVLTIQSEGGGIFVYEALAAAGRELNGARQHTRHIILFSDANDSEEPGDYEKLLADYEQSGITVSVIGLGTPSDIDAKLLEDVAKRGRGNIMFTDDAQELPRLFTQDTMSMARSSFIRKDPQTQPEGIAGRRLPSSRLMGEYVAGAFPHTDGYNLSYLKPEATLAVVSQDEYYAPWSAFWYRGLGRAAAITLEVDGQFSGEFGVWDEYADFLVTHARWLLGDAEPDDVFIKLARDGQDAIVSLEFDPVRPARQANEAPSLSIVEPSEEPSAAREVPFRWIDSHALEARFKLLHSGTYRTLVNLGGGNIVRGPVVSLPYSPEYLPRVGLPSGREVLEAIASMTGGRERVNVLDVLADPPHSAGRASLVPYLLGAAIVLLLAEIAGRRLGLWTTRVWSTESAAAEAAVADATAGTLPSGSSPASRFAAPQAEKAAVAARPAAGASPAPSAAEIYGQAKRRARQRMQ